MYKPLHDKGVNVSVKDLAAGTWSTWITTLGPFLLLAAFWFFMIRQMQMGGNKLCRSQERRACSPCSKRRSRSKTVAGVDEAKEESRKLSNSCAAQKFQNSADGFPRRVLVGLRDRQKLCWLAPWLASQRAVLLHFLVPTS